MADKNDDFLKKLLATFRIEADEHLAAMSSGLLELEKTPADVRQTRSNREHARADGPQHLIGDLAVSRNATVRIQPDLHDCALGILVFSPGSTQATRAGRATEGRSFDVEQPAAIE